MTNEKKFNLYLEWCYEVDKDWRKGLDEEGRAFVEKLDFKEASQRIRETEREIVDDVVAEIKGKIDPERLQRYKEHMAEYALAEAVLDLRRELLMDRNTLAELTGLSVEEITGIETATGAPTLQTLTQIANGTDFPVRISFTKWNP